MADPTDINSFKKRFQLTKDQRDQLGKLAFGSDARRTFLYELASNPKVLAAQGDDAATPAGPQ